MNDLVKMSIDGRKNAIFNAYNITDASIKEKIEDLFRRINEFGEGCTDNMDFETKFAASTLNQEYIQLFTEIATSCPQNVVETVENPSVKSDAEYVLDEMASEARYQAKEMSMPMRRQMRQEAESVARSTPIIGDIMEAKQYMDFFGRFRKKKDKKEEEENQDKE